MLRIICKFRINSTKNRNRTMLHLGSMTSFLLAVGLLCAVRVLGAQGDSYDFTCDMTPDEHDSILQDVVETLEQDRFTVEVGHMKFIYTSLFAGNPTSPYGLYLFEDTLIEKKFWWSLSERDAIIFFGCTPPQMKYFSFRSYVFTSFQGIVPRILFASLGDSLNLDCINTTDSTRKDPFGKTTVVTTTADIQMDQAVRDAFIASGLPATAINTDIIPSSLVKMGHGLLSDTFAMLYRLAVYEDPAEYHAYINYTWPVLYVRPPPDQNALPFATPPLRKRGTGKTELSYKPSLLEVVKGVNDTIQEVGNYHLMQEQMRPVYLEGYECIEEHSNCLGDNRDAAYTISKSRYTLQGEDDPSFFVVCGLNHVKTGKATYINFAVRSSIAVDDSMFGDSAEQYAPDLPNIDMFYAYKVARQCNGESYCLEIPLDVVEEDTPFNIISRSYLEPATEVGPDVDELLLPYVLYFTPNQ